MLPLSVRSGIFSSLFSIVLTLLYILKSITLGIGEGFADWTLLVFLFPFGMGGLYFGGTGIFIGCLLQAGVFFLVGALIGFLYEKRRTSQKNDSTKLSP